ncbi:glycoside hydrolase family 32 protein [Streptomyces boninensis]|uniref:glycoside hydrolase family 32 protein n=1 Tax=Streptomyces boninensis TaxID=2039455 RepID=UPI003B21C71A
MSRWRNPVLISAAALLCAALTAPQTIAASPDAPRKVRADAPTNPGFETGDLTGWTVVSGDAFAPGAVTDRAEDDLGRPFNAQGTHHLWGYAAHGDDAQGELRSSSFTAPTQLSFLIAGGWDPERLYVALVRDSDGRELLKQTGLDDEGYVRILWDTRKWRGQAVHLKVVDRKTGGWAHINLDDVRTKAADTADNGLHFNALGQARQPAPGTGTTPDRYAADPLRPQFHYTPYQGWINDPNGVVQWRGRHQLFSQHYPDAPKWGPMHWAHADSADAVRWRERPIALYPPKDAAPGDNSGIFSGSAVDDNGTLTVAYTRFTDTAAHPGATPETVEMATSTDGVNFTPVAQNPVIAKPPEGSGAGFRDPKLFKDPTDGKWKMVVGSGSDGKGKAQLYASTDLRKWDHVGVLAEGDGTDGAMWECPDLFQVDGKWVLLYSVNEGGKSVQRYAVGSYDGTRFTPEKRGILDGGGDVYAAQTYADDTGRRLAIGWLSDWNSKEPTRVNGWAGAQSVTRELFVTDDGRLGQRPVKELAGLANGTPVTASDKDVTGEWRLGTGRTARLQTAIDVRATTAPTTTIRLHTSSAEATELRYEKSTGTLTLDTTRAGYGTRDTFTTHAEPDADGVLSLDILIDRSSVEVFAGDGAALTARVYPRYRESEGVEFAAGGAGSVRIKKATLTPLGSSWS